MRLPVPAVLLVVACMTCVGIREARASWRTPSTSNPANAVSALLLEQPATAGVAATLDCRAVTVTWAPVTGADGYHVQRRVDGSAWLDAGTSPATATSWDDGSQAGTGHALEYRVAARTTSGTWSGPYRATAPTACGILGLTVEVPCSSTTVSWQPASGATSYDVQRRVDAGGWTSVATNLTTTTFRDDATFPLGSTVDYRVRPGVGSTDDGSWSSSASVTAWTPFRVTSIAVGDNATPGRLARGDTVTIDFSKPVATASVSAASTLRTRSSGQRGLSLAWNGSAAQIGTIATGGIWGANTTPVGTAAWNAARTRLVWTSTATGTTMDDDLSTGTFVAGTLTTCAADGATKLSTASPPVLGGRW